MPMAMQEIGGWENRDVVDAYARYAQICFELFGDRVLHWFTFNEPIVPVEGGYLYDFHYPNVVDFRRQPPWRITPCWPMRRPFRLTAPDTTRVRSASCST